MSNSNQRKPNQIRIIVDTINKMPELVRSRALTLLFGRTVRLTGTVGQTVEELTPTRCVISLKNHKAVQNHIGSVHAIANLLLAESATGYLIGINLPDQRVPVIKTIKADFVKRSKGNMRAEAELTAEQIELLHTQDKGETAVRVRITDSENKEPIIAEMIWAWTPKR